MRRYALRGDQWVRIKDFLPGRGQRTLNAHRECRARCGASDAVTVAQLKAAVVAAAPATAPIAAPSVDDANMRQELRALQALVTRLEAWLNHQQQEITELKGQTGGLFER